MPLSYAVPRSRGACADGRTSMGALEFAGHLQELARNCLLVVSRLLVCIDMSTPPTAQRCYRREDSATTATVATRARRRVRCRAFQLSPGTTRLRRCAFSCALSSGLTSTHLLAAAAGPKAAARRVRRAAGISRSARSQHLARCDKCFGRSGAAPASGAIKLTASAPCARRVLALPCIPSLELLPSRDRDILLPARSISLVKTPPRFNSARSRVRQGAAAATFLLQALSPKRLVLGFAGASRLAAARRGCGRLRLPTSFIAGTPLRRVARLAA
eukprot:364942-Chlamydomonas_euryale.AAC.14